MTGPARPRRRARPKHTGRRPTHRGVRFRRARRARRLRIAFIVTLIAVPVLVVGGIVALVGAAVGAFECRRDALAPLDTPFATVGYTQEQLDNAATIMAAGRDAGLSLRDQTIGVMTALGESSLRNLDYGDWETSGVTNPDGTRTTSLGLFQQQDAWGTREERLDPYTAAGLFFTALAEKVPERNDMAPTLVAHRVQVNADADHYAPYWPAAVRIVEALSGVDSGLDPGTGAQSC